MDDENDSVKDWSKSSLPSGKDPGVRFGTPEENAEYKRAQRFLTTDEDFEDIIIESRLGTQSDQDLVQRLAQYGGGQTLEGHEMLDFIVARNTGSIPSGRTVKGKAVSDAMKNVQNMQTALRMKLTRAGVIDVMGRQIRDIPPELQQEVDDLERRIDQNNQLCGGIVPSSRNVAPSLMANAAERRAKRALPKKMLASKARALKKAGKSKDGGKKKK